MERRVSHAIWSGGIEEVYNLEDALMVALHLNAFIRHADMVKMANIAQIVNMIAPIRTTREGLVLQTIFYPFEVYSQHCGDTALDVYWEGDTFDGGATSGVRVLDVAATLDTRAKRAALFMVNRTPAEASDVEIKLETGHFAGSAQMFVINGADIKTENTFEAPDGVTTRQARIDASGDTLRLTLEPHSVTAVLLEIA